MKVHVYALGRVPLLLFDHDLHEAPPEAVPCGSLDLSHSELRRVLDFLDERTRDLLRRGDDVRWIGD